MCGAGNWEGEGVCGAGNWEGEGVCGAGNWEGEGRFKMWFNHGGAIEFGQAMLHAGQLGELTSWFSSIRDQS